VLISELFKHCHVSFFPNRARGSLEERELGAESRRAGVGESLSRKLLSVHLVMPQKKVCVCVRVSPSNDLFSLTFLLFIEMCSHSSNLPYLWFFLRVWLKILLTAFAVGQLAVGGGAVVGVGALCYYGLGMSARPGTLEMARWG